MQERHTLGGNHLHCYVRLGSHYRSRGAHRNLELHSPDTADKWYPNVQGVWNKLYWLKYLSKEDDDPYTEGIDLKKYIEARSNKRSVIGSKILEGVHPRDLVKEHPELALHYSNLKRSYDSLNLDSHRPEDTDGSKGIWCVGPKGSGKSRWAQDTSLKLFGELPFKLTYHSWFDEYAG